MTLPQTPLPTAAPHLQPSPPFANDNDSHALPSTAASSSSTISYPPAPKTASAPKQKTLTFPRHSLLRHLPAAVSHFLGHRPPHVQHAAAPTPVTTLWNTSGTLLSILAVAGTMIQLYGFNDATVVGSIGAAATLLFLAPASPLAQPRHMFPSQLMAAVIGVSLSHAIPHWLAYGLSVGFTALMMQLTHCVYPPAGATAVLAVLDGRWAFVGRVMSSTAVVAAVGCLWVNLPGAISRWECGRWPMWWIWPDDVPKAPEMEKLVISRDGVVVSTGVEVTVEERWVLERIWERMRLHQKEDV